MIVNHEKKWIYISPPKTSSTSLCYLLTDGKYQNNLWGPTLEPNFEGEAIYGQHFPYCDERLPDQYTDYMKFISVRNPFSRWPSLWKHWRFGNNLNQGNQEKIGVGLEKFLKMVQLARSDGTIELGDNRFFTTNCSSWYHPGYKVIYFENLEQDLKRLKLHKNDFKIPHLNDFKHIGIKIEELKHTEETIDLVHELGASDFELFGYDTNF